MDVGIALEIAERAIEGRESKHERAMFAMFEVAKRLKQLKAGTTPLGTAKKRLPNAPDQARNGPLPPQVRAVVCGTRWRTSAELTGSGAPSQDDFKPRPTDGLFPGALQGAGTFLKFWI